MVSYGSQRNMQSQSTNSQSQNLFSSQTLHHSSRTVQNDEDLSDESDDPDVNNKIGKKGGLHVSAVSYAISETTG